MIYCDKKKHDFIATNINLKKWLINLILQGKFYNTYNNEYKLLNLPE